MGSSGIYTLRYKCTNPAPWKRSDSYKTDVNVEKAGTYYTTYSATDKMGNVGKVVQKVVVQDTLKPVIGLKVGGSVVHQGAAKDTGVQGQKNPAHGYSFMAEQSGTGAFALAGVVAALAGVALMAFGGSKKTEIDV